MPLKELINFNKLDIEEICIRNLRVFRYSLIVEAIKIKTICSHLLILHCKEHNITDYYSY